MGPLQYVAAVEGLNIK